MIMWGNWRGFKNAKIIVLGIGAGDRLNGYKGANIDVIYKAVRIWD